MIVLDASAVLEWLLEGPASGAIEARVEPEYGRLHAPHLVDLEVVQVLRRLVREGAVRERRAGEAVEDLLALRLVRHEHRRLTARIWALRGNLTAYDAAYVALAESIGAPLLTRDARLARSSGHRARIELV